MGLFKRNKVWWMTFIYQGRQVRRSTECTDRRLAEAVLGKIKVKLVEGRYFDRLEEQERTFEEMVERYVAERVVGASRHGERRARGVLAHLLPVFGKKTLVQVTPKEIAATLNANVRNTIISGNSGAAANPDALGAFNSQGNNIIGVVGTSTGWVASDLQNVNPLLGPLGSYGGIGQTYPLLTTSPALNAGQNCVTDLSCAIGNPPAAITTDQRGAARPFGGTA